jgi:hypothetical protein
MSKHLGDSALRDAVAGGQPAKVIAGGAAGMRRAAIEQRRQAVIAAY